MTKEILIIALILIVFYYYCQAKKSANSTDQEKARIITQIQAEKTELETKLLAAQTKYKKQAKLLDEEQLENNKLTEQISQLESKIVELNKSDWATNRLTELEANLRAKEAQIKDLEKQLRTLKKKK